MAASGLVDGGSITTCQEEVHSTKAVNYASPYVAGFTYSCTHAGNTALDVLALRRVQSCRCHSDLLDGRAVRVVVTPPVTFDPALNSSATDVA